jgi:hypothetical protein
MYRFHSTLLYIFSFYTSFFLTCFLFLPQFLGIRAQLKIRNERVLLVHCGNNMGKLWIHIDKWA